MIHAEAVRRLENWVRSGRRSIAVLTGPRGVGKTAVIDAVGTHYQCRLEVRMESSFSARAMLSGCPCMKDFIRRIEEHFGLRGI